VKRSVLPAITHVDYSARLQTISPERNGRYYRLLKAFEKRTGCGVMVNTSFNVRGEPIVCTPDDAYRCFMATDMDLLVVEDFVMVKSEQPADPSFDRAKHLARFSPD
jgi:carbamoyltransferase